MREKKFCAQICQQAQEPMIGTAARADFWCLLEYTERWNEFAIRDSILPPGVLAWQKEVQNCFPDFRMQLIKQHHYPQQTITCFFAITRHGQQALYRFQLKKYTDLLQIDLSALVDGAACYKPYLEHEPLFLICTHGKHDRCCAKFGLPIYYEVTQLVGNRAWQSSHVGGDKFAANLLCMPYGLYYGHVAALDVKQIIDATYNRHIYLEKFRGCSNYPSVVQAAEYFLREQTGILDLDAFALSQIKTVSGTLCRVTFAMREAEINYCLTVQMNSTEVTYSSSCHGLQTSQVTYYHMLSCQRQENLRVVTEKCVPASHLAQVALVKANR